jgi:membrane protein
LTTRDAARRALRFAGRFVDGLRSHGGLEAAASIAFWFFLSLVPLLVLLGFLVGQVARARGVDALVAPLLDVVPGTAEDIVRKELERMAGGTASLAPVVVVGYLWTASSGLHNLMDVFEAAAKVEPRPWWKQRVIALVWVVLGLAVAVLLAVVLVKVDGLMRASETGPAAGVSATATPIAPSSATTTQPSAAPAAAPSTRADRMQSTRPLPAGARVRGALKHRVSKALHTPAEQAVAATVMLFLGALFLAGFYRFAVEHPKGVRRRVWPGTLTAVGSWLVVSWGFGIYVVSMASYALYYGSLAAVAVMLVWLYLTSLSLVAGAEVNVQLERGRVSEGRR